jgi:riboflavin synthase
MFTGIIEGVGSVVSLDERGDFHNLRVKADSLLGDLAQGSSIAVNGVCLTVRSHDHTSFSADLSRETLDRTSLKGLSPGGLVNLERPMRADGRFGGHIVQGHVDGTGRILEFKRDNDNWILRVEVPKGSSRYLVHKGSIAVDGISLTVASLQDSSFDVAIIPHTLENTNLRQARTGDIVNLEYDVIAKYVERMLHRENG